MVESHLSGRGGKTPPDATFDTEGKDPEGFFRAGITLLRRKQPQDALRPSSAPSTWPRRTHVIFLSTACASRASGGPERGGAALREGCEKEFYRPEIHLNLGKALLMAGRPEKAQKAFREGLALDGDNREIIRELENMESESPRFSLFSTERTR